MADKTWKQVERRVVRLIGGRRTGHHILEDVAHPILSLEVKHREKLPAWLLAAWAQAQRNAPVGKVPMVVLHQAGSRRYLAVLDLEDLAGLLENAPAQLGLFTSK